MKILLIIFAIAGFVFCVAFPAAIFVVAMWEKRRVPRLTPVDAAEVSATPKQRAFINSAIAAGFALVGDFNDNDPGFTKGIVTLLLSSDGEILVVVRHSKTSGRASLISEYKNQHWLMSDTITGHASLSGMEDALDFCDASFPVLHAYHVERMNARTDDPIAFEKFNLISALNRHWQASYKREAELGYAHRLLTEKGERFRYTLKGAVVSTRNYFRSMSRMLQMRSEVEKRTQALDPAPDLPPIFPNRRR